MSGSGLPSFFLVMGNTTMSHSMLGTSSPDDGLVSQYTYWSTLWVGHNSPSYFTQDDSTSHSIWITTFLVFIPISTKASSTGIPTGVITYTDIYGYQDTCMLHFLTWLVGTPINLTGGIITSVIGLSAPISSLVNRNTGWCSFLSFTISECAAKDAFVGKLSTSFSLHNYVDLL